MSDVEEELVAKRLKIVLVGDSGSGKVSFDVSASTFDERAAILAPGSIRLRLFRTPSHLFDGKTRSTGEFIFEFRTINRAEGCHVHLKFSVPEHSKDAATYRFISFVRSGHCHDFRHAQVPPVILE